ncbi:transporter substrate-binding domain-containing protein [Azospirillum sp.]|uniref:substrate-binding periplasmic protein n=1 Tax=Azospirillum sp. TaxID=34012 RepID=UPI0026109CA9|nr:transporter substrate-binding domain-containing protein [Azospirillum sp.]
MALRARSIIVGAACFLGLTQAGLGAESVTLHYFERPPYMTKMADGGVRGLTATAAESAFAKAGIPFTWALTPAQRQLDVIRRNQGRDCGVGWFKTHDRAAFGAFTNPIYQDQPPVAILRKAVELPPEATLKTVLSDHKLRVLVKMGLTYGGYIKNIVAKYGDNLTIVSAEQAQMLLMIAANRADLMFAGHEEASLLLERHPEVNASVRMAAFPDVPPGEHRHILCSRAVGDDVIAALNAALAAR